MTLNIIKQQAQLYLFFAFNSTDYTQVRFMMYWQISDAMCTVNSNTLCGGVEEYLHCSPRQTWEAWKMVISFEYYIV